jgi:hypothetical protein
MVVLFRCNLDYCCGAHVNPPLVVSFDTFRSRMDEPFVHRFYCVPCGLLLIT